MAAKHVDRTMTEQVIDLTCTKVNRYDGNPNDTVLGFVTAQINAKHVEQYFNQFNEELAEYWGETQEKDNLFHQVTATYQTVAIKNVAFTHPLFLTQLEETLSSYSRLKLEEFRKEADYKFKTTEYILELLTKATTELVTMKISVEDKTLLITKLL